MITGQRRVLILDAGQTSSRLSINADLDQVSELDGVITDDPVLPQLAERIRQGIEIYGPVTGVAIGSTGLPDDATAAELLQLLQPVGIATVWLAHDSVTNYLACLGARPGVVVAAGTGVVTLAVGESAVARVDGWGYLIGDAGSGYWIGRAGLEAVLRAFDGRGPATALTTVVTADFPDLAGLYLSLQNDHERVSRIASYAQAVTELADHDGVCRRICRQAGDELAHSALTGLDLVGLASRSDVTIGLGGRLFSSPTLRTEFCELIGRHHRQAQFIDSSASSLTGVAQLPELPPDSALLGRVDVATG